MLLVGLRSKTSNWESILHDVFAIQAHKNNHEEEANKTEIFILNGLQFFFSPKNQNLEVCLYSQNASEFPEFL